MSKGNVLRVLQNRIDKRAEMGTASGLLAK